MSKHDLIDMIITERSKKVIYTRENHDLTKEGANDLLKINNFARPELKENNISNILSEAKAIPKALNNQKNNSYFLTLIHNN